MRKIYDFASEIIVVLLILIIILVSYWELYPYKPLEFKTVPHEISSKSIFPGGHVNFILDYCKHMDLGSEVTVTFADGFIYNTQPIASNIEKGCHLVEQSIYVPRAIPLGTYSIRILYRYKVNPIRTIDVITETQKFEVTKL